MAVLGMVVGAAFCHNFGLASSADGPTFNGKVAVIIGLIVVAALGQDQLEPQKGVGGRNMNEIDARGYS